MQHGKDIEINFENYNSKDGCNGGDDGDKNCKNEFQEQIIMMAVLSHINVFCPKKNRLNNNNKN